MLTNKSNLMHKIKTYELAEILKMSEIKIIDIRPVEGYNGWILGNEMRGGHIKGAKSLPYKWFNNINWIEIVKAKRIARED
jgi:3-mercaptopyruvate sulfurtransferase SseA